MFEDFIKKIMSQIQGMTGSPGIRPGDPRLGALPEGSPQANALANLTDEEREMVMRKGLANGQVQRAKDIFGGLGDVVRNIFGQ